MDDGLRRVTVRFFAAARAAAGVETAVVTVPADASFGDLVDELRRYGAELSRVLDRCSYLRDGVAVRDLGGALATTETVDVLPPFAGG